MVVVVDLSAFFGGRQSVPCSPSADGDTTTAHSRTVSEMGLTSGLDTLVGRLCPVSVTGKSSLRGIELGRLAR
jgi:hypothetical protein